MKKIFGLFAIALSFVMLSCQKDESFSKMTFKASIDKTEKTHLGGSGNYSILWDLNDDVLISDGTNNVHYFVTSIGQNNVATLSCHEGEDVNEGASYKAVYPGDRATFDRYGNVRITLPATQTYYNNQMDKFPMYAESNERALSFKNMCGVLRLHLQAASGSSNPMVKSVTVSVTNKVVNGQFNATRNGQTYQINATNVGTTTAAVQKQIVLDCGDGVNISNGVDFNIYLPVGEYSGLNIDVLNTEEQVLGFKANANVSFTRNQVLTITQNSLKFAPRNTTGGLFSTEINRQVYIASGNLMNTVGPNGDYSDAWKFSEKPYGLYGSYSNNQTVWNRFSWSTDDRWDGTSQVDQQMRQQAGGLTRNNYGMFTAGCTDSRYTDGSFVDWGTNRIQGVNGEYDAANTWYTMTYDHWRYLIGETSWVNGHQVATYGRLKDGKMTGGATRTFDACYVLPEAGYFIPIGTRNNRPVYLTRSSFPYTLNGKTFPGIPCICIYPDAFPGDKMINVSVENGMNQDLHALTDERYQELVRLHCAFLPIVGQGQGAAAQTSLQMLFNRSNYWTSTANGDQSAYAFYFVIDNGDERGHSYDPDTRYNGNPVRLVQDAN